MAVSYRKLRELMIKYRIKTYEIKESTGLSNGVLSKINKNEYIQLEKLDLICQYLEKRIQQETGQAVKIDFNDIMERE